MSGSDIDVSTLSTYKNVTVEECAISAKINWDEKNFFGTVSYTLTAHSSPIALDTSFLNVSKITWDGQELSKWEIKERQSFQGSPLEISDVPVDVKGQLSIEFSTTSDCTGLQWLEPEQTYGKKIPFMYSQCEPIHARSIFPCFDTPAIKVPFRFKIESKYPVLVSGLPVTDSEFVQKVPIPSYLFAIASGNLESKPIGPRSHVWAEPEMVKACQWEFEADVEKQLKAAEELVFPYEWGKYDVLSLPPSFCFGGMENPVNTFATPTLIAGDRTLVNVIAHELAHSWSGNLVTNSSWDHFWLNEGWTVYLERRILGKLHGEAYRNFAAIEGWHDLVEAVNKQPAQFTKLVVGLDSSQDPDDAFSTVPYEKGSTFLWYLENLVGRDSWDAFIPKYFTKFKYKSLNTEQFIETLYENFDKQTLDQVDWNLWLHTPGLPPKPEFDQTLAIPCSELASKWMNNENINSELWKKWASVSDVKDMNPLQIIVLLNTLNSALPTLNVQNTEKLAAAVGSIGELYNLTKSRNPEVLFRWLQLAVSSGVPGSKETLAKWVGGIGRMKFVRPSYVLLNKVDHELALATFESNKNFYHAICRTMVEKDLAKSS